MAVRIALANSTLTSGTWKEAEAYSLDFTHSAANYDDSNTARNIAVEFASAGNQQGLFLACRIGSVSSGVFTIKLQSADGLTTYTTDNFTVNTTFSPLTEYAGVLSVGNTQLMYFPLTTYAVNTGAGLYRYNISCNVASKIYLWRTAVAGDYTYAAILDADTSNPSSADTLIVANGYTLTNNATFTYGATDGNALFVCENAVWAWTSPAAAYTATFQGKLVLSNNSQVNIGSSGNAISVANQATIDLTALTSTWWGGGAYNTWGYQNTVFNIYGFEDTSLSTRANGQAAASQAVITTKEDMSAVWQIGDSIELYGKAQTNSAVDNVTYTIQNIVGTTLTLNTNLNYFLYDKGGILNTTRATTQVGVKILCPAGTTAFYITNSTNHSKTINIHGCYIQNGTILMSTSINSTNWSVYRTYVYTDSTATCVSLAPQSSGGVVNMLDVFGKVGGNGQPFYIGGSGAYVYNSTITNIFGKNGVYVLTAALVNCTLSKLAGYCVNRTSNYGFWNTYGNLLTVSDSLINGGGSPIYLVYSLNATTFTDCIIDCAGVYAIYYRASSVNLDFINCKIGSISASGTDDVYVLENQLVRSKFNNCAIGSAGVTNTSNMINTSYLKFDTYNVTSNDHRSWYKYGKMVSVGSGLTDTTVHTAGGYALRFEPTSSTNNLEWEFNIPTGNIQNKTMMIGVWCKINNANYWSGTNQMPRITVNYDDGTTAYTQAAQTTDWQLLPLPFTPATTYGEVTVTLSGRTDATTTNAYVYWDDFVCSYPPNSALDLGSMDYFADALPVVPPIALPLSAGSVASAVWESLLTTHTTTGTTGKKLKDLKNPTALVGPLII